MQLALGAQTIPPLHNPGVPIAGAAPNHALELAFEAHHAMVFRVAYRVTGNAADAEDVLQTVFLRLAGQQPESGNGVENIEAYLRRAAVNASINLLEKRSRTNTPLESAPEPRTSPDQRDLRETLRNAIGTLAGRTAEMFALRFIEGHSNAEIADMFGVSALVVGVTLHRARKHLQKVITESGGLQ